MSAKVEELLREAAKTMRERASAVEPGQWTAELPGKGNAWINTPGWPHAWGMHGFIDEAKHVAAFASPAVALAVADWLEAVAEYQMGDTNELESAETVARAYLGRRP